MSVNLAGSLSSQGAGFLAWMQSKWFKCKSWFVRPLMVAPVVILDEPTSTTDEIAVSPIWDFKTGILDRLDEYFGCMRLMRRHDPDAYALYSRIGLSMPSKRLIADAKLTDYPRVTFGGILLGLRDVGGIDKSKLQASFMYFSKITTPAAVQWFKGDVYHVVTIYDDRLITPNWRSRLSHPVEFHVGVNADGTPHLLKELRTTSSQVTSARTRRGNKGSKQSITIKSRHWAYPNLIKDIAAEHGTTANEWAVDLFKLCFCTSAECQKQIIVRTKKDGMTAAFGIEAHNAKVFFKDRDLTILARDGKRKRIFHSVVSHPRTLRTGRITEVKAHYRGLRHFPWNDYEVGIVFPKNNHLLQYDGGAKYEADLKPQERRGWLHTKEVGSMINERLSA